MIISIIQIYRNFGHGFTWLLLCCIFSSLFISRLFLQILARDLGMANGDYLYFAVELFESLSWGILSARGTDGRDADAKSAFKSLLVVALEDEKTLYWQSFAATFETRARNVYNYSFAEDGNVVLFTMGWKFNLLQWSQRVDI